MNSGIGFSTLLGVLFIGLKLADIIDWNWWWVLSPFWIGFMAGAAIIIIAVFGSLGRRHYPRRRF